MRGVGRLRLLAAGLIATATFAGTPADAANLFDAIRSIFGADPQPSGRQQAPVRQYFRYEDLEPADDRPRHRREPRSAESERTRSPVNTAIDPLKVPTWYLSDPTLRRGDIVVLQRGVFVVEGGRFPFEASDFVPLERSRLPSPERARIAAMTGYRPAAAIAEAPRAKKAAELGTGAPISR